MSIRGRDELGQNVTTRLAGERVPPPTPGIQKNVLKRVKTGGLDAIRACTRPCNRKKAKEMLRAVRNDARRRKLRGGFPSNQPRET